MLAITTASTIITGSSPAFGATLDVGYTLEGCRPGTFNQNTITCADGDYTTGNLGKSWSELDLVPFRVTLDNNSGSAKSGTFVVAGDYKNGAGTGTGWDVISVLTLDTAKSDVGCPAVTSSGTQTITPSGQGVGGADQTIYRVITATIPAGHTCVYNYYMRLALGAHNFSGSSLQANLWNDALGSQGIGQKRVSLPVAEIAPQGLSKTMRAVRDADFVWTLEKTATPVEAEFANTCDPAAPRTLPVTITLRWRKSEASPSGYTVTTVVTATNPALRTITVQATDSIFAGTTHLETVVGSAVDVPANTSMPVLTHILNITPAQLTAAGVLDPNNPSFNDRATATYTDKLTGVPVPGTTSATASVDNANIGSGGVSGDSIVVTDSESITPNVGLDFSVAAPSVGSFVGYTEDTFTTGPVNWTSGTQTSSGSVTFNKTVRVAAATATSGILSDTAIGTFGSNTTNASASTSLSSSPLVSLTINKRRSPVTNEAQTFNFVVKDASDTTVASPSITIPGGTPATTDVSATVNGLDPGTYTVFETATGPYGAQNASATITLPRCDGQVSFNNVAAPARARVEKITVPASGTVWSFTLSGPDVGINGTETVNATAGASYVNFTSALDTDGAVYTITENAVLPGYDATGVVGDFTTSSATRAADTSLANRTCSFTLDQPTDSGGVLSCTFTNTERGALRVHKTVIANDSGNTLNDTFTICITGPSYPAPTVQNGGCQTTSVPGGDLTWTNLLPGTYTVSEAPPGTSWIVGINPVSVNVPPGATASAVASTVTNTHKGRARVIKTVSAHDGSNPQAPSGTESFPFQLRTGTTDILGNPGTLLETATADAGNNGQFTFTTLLTPGQVYQVCETGLDPAWMVQLSPGPQFVPEQWTDATRTVLNPNVVNDTYCVNFTAQPGPDPTVITVNNFRPPEGFALTIGYWKNHASCSSSNGKQDPTLDQVLASFPIASGQTTHGVYIGLVYVDTCLEAVRLLNKSTINTNKKFASDPLFNLAAQLLAAKLNLQAGAGTCADANTAINAAQALLEANNFNGTGTVKLKSSQVSGANSLAHTLDLYNNNLLC